MLKISEIAVDGFEKVIELTDDSVGLHAFIAIHDSRLGPGLGGTRIHSYASRLEALQDVLRLAEGMTYKAAITKVGLGGAKGVIITDPKHKKSKPMLHAYAEGVNSLKGQFITAEDVGSSIEDVSTMSEKTPYVVGLPLEIGSGDPSPFAAWGVFQGIRAVCRTLFGNDDVRGRKIAIQGLGKVGICLANHLFWRGCNLVLSDVKKEHLRLMSRLFDAEIVSPEEIHKAECDIFAPCALGGILNSQTIPELKCQAVAGSANNQLQHESDARLLHERGILYAPDFVINAGGLINVSQEVIDGKYHAKESKRAVDQIFDTLIAIFERAKTEEQPTEMIAMQIAKEYLESKITI